MKISYFKLTVIIVLFFQLGGCASVLNGSKQDVSIKTHPDAEIYIDDRYSGNGFTKRELRRNESHVIRVTLNDCEQTYITQAKFNKTSLLGLMLDLGLLSIPIDFSTGAAWDIYPNKFIMQPDCMTQ